MLIFVKYYSNLYLLNAVKLLNAIRTETATELLHATQIIKSIIETGKPCSNR